MEKSLVLCLDCSENQSGSDKSQTDWPVFCGSETRVVHSGGLGGETGKKKYIFKGCEHSSFNENKKASLEGKKSIHLKGV